MTTEKDLWGNEVRITNRKKATRRRYYYNGGKEKQKLWRRKNPDRNKEYQRCYRARSGSVDRNRNRNRNLKKRYNLSLAEKEELLASQNYVCAICKGMLWGKRGPCVDHDHITKQNRGILCTNCNSVIAHAGDSISILRAAIKYIQYWKRVDSLPAVCK
jgi:DNA-directed RNA polymerase subunit RPC12/RpoP